VPKDAGTVAQDELAVKEFVADLARLVRNRGVDRQLVTQRVLSLYGLGRDPSMLAFPVVRIFEQKNGKTMRVFNYRVIAPTVLRAFGYVLSLLLDDERAEGARLRRCQLESCGAFFLKEKPEIGQGRFRYCGKDHQEQAERMKSAERVAAKRAGLSVHEWRKREWRKRR